jgi:hypothetical protein
MYSACCLPKAKKHQQNMYYLFLMATIVTNTSLNFMLQGRWVSWASLGFGEGVDTKYLEMNYIKQHLVSCAL